MIAVLSFVIFVVLRALPGNPFNSGGPMPPELLEQLTIKYGLDQPVLVQYVKWVQGVFHGDLGVSFVSRQPISNLLVQRVPATLHLAIASLLVAIIVGLPLGFIAGIKKDTWLDKVTSMTALLGLSVPQFWLGTIFVLTVGVRLRWLPTSGYVAFTQDPIRSLQFTIMPALTIGLSLAPYLARMTRTATVEVQQEPFVALAQAKGLKLTTVMNRYSIRNAFPPVVVIISMQLGGLLGGVVIIEKLFAWPGVGQLLIGGVGERDYQVVLSCVLVLAILWVVMNLLADLLQAALDPRIRLGKR